jgi:transposase
MTDKGSDAQGNRKAARSRGICPIIPYRRTARHRPAFFPQALYRRRARIEQTIGKLKRFKRVALRCEKPPRTTPPSWPSPAPSSGSNPSTSPRA